MEYHKALALFFIFFNIVLAEDPASETGISEMKDLSGETDISKIIPGAWILHIPAGLEVAKRIARIEGFQSVYEIPNLKLFHLYDLERPEEIEVEHMYIRLSKYEEVTYATPSMEEKVRRRDYSMMSSSQEEFYYCAGPESSILTSNRPQFYTDPLYPKQWYLRSCSEMMGSDKPSYYDMKIVQAWDQFKVSGKGVIVISADDGVYRNHIDLKDRISNEFSKNYIRGGVDPTPTDPDDNHGTRCAGIMAMEANNGVCGVGISPKITLGAHKFMEGSSLQVPHQIEAFSFRSEDIHVMTSSTGDFESKAFIPMRKEVESAFYHGITSGRGGKGVVYVFPSGNGKGDKETCSTDGQLQIVPKIIVGGAKHNGSPSDYAEGCPAVMVVTHSGNGNPYAHITPDLGRTDNCFENFNGTSAGCPVAAAILALVMEANPNLSWRDVKHAIAWTSEVAPLAKNPGWTKNAAGFYVNFNFGFGLINAYQLVELATNFPGTTPPMNTCVLEYNLKESETYVNGQQSVKITIPMRGCRDTTQVVKFVEHVHLTLSIDHIARGNLQIFLTSPQRTVTEILPPRPKESFSAVIQDFSILSVHNWGEAPQGNWVVEIMDISRSPSSYGQISKVGLTIYGSETKPELFENGPRKYLPFSLK